MRCTWPTLSPDGRTIFALGGPPSTGAEHLLLVRGEFGHWIGRAPDNAPLALREKGDAPEVYALDVEWP